jgi:hypothetical protein
VTLNASVSINDTQHNNALKTLYITDITNRASNV